MGYRVDWLPILNGVCYRQPLRVNGLLHLTGIFVFFTTSLQEHIPSDIVAHISGYLPVLQIGNRGSFVSPMIPRTSSTVLGFPSDVNSFTRFSLACEFLEMKASFTPTSRRRYLNKMFQLKLTKLIWPLDLTSILFPVVMGKINLIAEYISHTIRKYVIFPRNFLNPIE